MRYLIVSIYCSLLSLTFAADKVSLDSFVASYGFPSPTRTEGKLLVRSRYTEMAFTSDSRMMRYNGMLIWMNAGAYAGRREWNITKADAEKVLAPLLRAKDFASKQDRPKLVLIDPGHGGSQTGAKPRTGGLYEKKLALDIAIRLRDRLAKKGIKCALTRDRDRTLSLAARSRKVGQLGADLFVSIHLNSAGNTAAKGIETYLVPVAGFRSTSGGKGSTKRVVGNRNDELNSVLAYLLQRDMLKATGAADRGVKRARFDVISNASCPAVLVECGFLSNRAENIKLQKTSYRDTIAKGLADGVSNYFKIWKKP